MARVLVFASLIVVAAACSSSEDGGNEGAVDAAPPDGPEEVAAADASPAPVPGLCAQYFRHHAEPPAIEQIDTQVDFHWGEASPSDALGVDHFSVRWSGTLDVPAAGDYTFVVTADDGVRLWVGDASEPLIEDWTFHASTRSQAHVNLPAGPATIRLEYFEKDYAANVALAWSSATFAEQIIPADRLTAAPADPAARAPRPPYDNPVVPFSCPDPGVLADEVAGVTTFYMVCTGGRFRIRTSADLVLWEDSGKFILPTDKPDWAANGSRNWAPELHRVGSTYVAYFTAADANNHLAIGSAVASSPLGPYTVSGAPLVQDPLGVIDASYFRDDDGKSYLLYKIDGNSQGKPTPIYARELAADGLSFAPGSDRHQLLVNDGGTWEGGVIEGPWLVKREGKYYLFYSGNVYDDRYRTGVARAGSVLGPYEKRGAPILVNNARWVGPGHGSVVRVGEKDYFAYHAWPATPSGDNDSSAGRHGLVDRIVWESGWPKIADGSPSRGLEPWPVEP